MTPSNLRSTNSRVAGSNWPLRAFPGCVVDTEQFEQGAALLGPVGGEILGLHLHISLAGQIDRGRGTNSAEN